VYIGARENGKLTRIYEKGKQLGDITSPWTRIELELHNKSRVIPLDALIRPAAYLAGAFPCLRYLSVEQCKIKTIGKAAKTAYTKAVEVARNQYGKLVNLMVQVHGGDALAVVRDLVREGLPGRLDPFSYQLYNDQALVYSLSASDESHAAVVA
jgi:phage replication initiation protein